MSALYARVIVRLRWVVILAWVAAAVAAVTQLPTIEQTKGALSDLVPTDAEAIEAEIRSVERFAFPVISRNVIVQRNPDGLPPATLGIIGSRAVDLSSNARPDQPVAGAVPVVNLPGTERIAREEGTTALTFLFFRPEVGLTAQRRTTELFAATGGSDVVGVTGAIPARLEQARTILRSLTLVTILTVLLVLAAVGWHFRALAAPFVTLAAVAIAYVISTRLIARLGQAADLPVPSEVEPVIVVLLFGVVCDYAIFYLSRFRKRICQGVPACDAAEIATREMSGIILCAGLTVAAASAALLVAELSFFRAFGPGMAVAVLVALAVSLTFVPAALAIGGRRLFWPGRIEPPPASEGASRTGVLEFVARHPWLVAIGCIAALTAGATGVTRIEVDDPVLEGLPADSDQRQAYEAAAKGFVPGVVSPTVLLVERLDIADDRKALAKLQVALERREGVAAVVGPSSPVAGLELGAMTSRDGGAARFVLVSGEDPYGADAIGSIGDLREALPAMLDAAGLGEARASLAGDTALSEETTRATAADLRRITPAALLAVFLVLAIFLRALVAPLYLVGASVLALAATLGIAHYVLGDLTFYVPFTGAVLLLALGSDYNVFLAGRVWTEGERRPLEEAVSRAGARASAAITVAGIVLALSFALLALVPLRPFRELAFVMSLGLLLDALFVRTLLVPALIALVGERSGWPGKRIQAPSLGAFTGRHR